MIRVLQKGGKLMPIKTFSLSTKKYLEAFNQAPAIYNFTPSEIREMKSKAPVVSFEYPEIYEVKDYYIPVDGGEIRIRHYHPESQEPRPTILYFHGGGWVLGEIESNELGNRQLVLKTGFNVLSVEYRLAPEYMYPVPLNDCESAYKWAVENAANLNINMEKVYVAGDSAGGNLAIALANRLGKRSISIEGQLLIYPVTDLNYHTASYDEYEKGYGLDQELMKCFAKYYVGDNSVSEEIAVLNSNNQQPINTLIIAAEHDVLLDEGVLYKEKLEALGASVDYHVISGTVHGFYSNVPLFVEETDSVTTIIANYLQKG